MKSLIIENIKINTKKNIKRICVYSAIIICWGIFWLIGTYVKIDIDVCMAIIIVALLALRRLIAIFFWRSDEEMNKIVTKNCPHCNENLMKLHSIDSYKTVFYTVLRRKILNVTCSKCENVFSAESIALVDIDSIPIAFRIFLGNGKNFDCFEFVFTSFIILFMTPEIAFKGEMYWIVFNITLFVAWPLNILLDNFVKFKKKNNENAN